MHNFDVYNFIQRNTTRTLNDLLTAISPDYGFRLSAQGHRKERLQKAQMSTAWHIVKWTATLKGWPI